jgi:hypothetical protein
LFTLAASLKRSPDTNPSFHCTTTPKTALNRPLLRLANFRSAKDIGVFRVSSPLIQAGLTTKTRSQEHGALVVTNQRRR